MIFNTVASLCYCILQLTTFVFARKKLPYLPLPAPLSAMDLSTGHENGRIGARYQTDAGWIGCGGNFEGERKCIF
ncbi:hypothetical protein F5Y17DRAFT_418985 [Xylariaceae sp. FL0594]|nr:hypothetical protein F5Y17DRAFT_418985 [Xylariaceae sp. FL0594]